MLSDVWDLGYSKNNRKGIQHGFRWWHCDGDWGRELLLNMRQICTYLNVSSESSSVICSPWTQECQLNYSRSCSHWLLSCFCGVYCTVMNLKHRRMLCLATSELEWFAHLLHLQSWTTFLRLFWWRWWEIAKLVCVSTLLLVSIANTRI